jgi:uncharacterized protein YkwD
MPRTLPQAIGFLFGMWLAIALSPLWIASASAEDATLEALERGLLDEVNRVRAEHHLIGLERRSDLDRVAQGHSDDMAQRRYFAHESPEGVDPLARIETARLEMTLAAENLGHTSQRDPNRAIVREWLLSASHRQNLLAPFFNSTGIGIARSADGGLLYTQVYVTLPRHGTPAS